MTTTATTTATTIAATTRTTTRTTATTTAQQQQQQPEQQRQRHEHLNVVSPALILTYVAATNASSDACVCKYVDLSVFQRFTPFHVVSWNRRLG